MPVPATLGDLSVTAASNSPAGSESPNTVDDYLRAHASFLAYLRDGKQFTTEATLASAATCDIGGASSLYVKITGTTAITSFGTDYQGPRFLRFESALTLTHNALSLILPGGANITTAAGDTAIAVPQSGGWRIVSYQRADGTLFSNASFGSSLGSSGYQRLPSGLLIQWGSPNMGAGTSLAVTWPIAFPTALLSVVAMDIGSTAGMSTSTQSTTGATFVASSAPGVFNYIAIGN